MVISRVYGAKVRLRRLRISSLQIFFHNFGRFENSDPFVSRTFVDSDLTFVSITVKEARKFPDIKLVNFDWLTASINSRRRADESQFAFEADYNPDDATNSPGPTPFQQNKGKGKKRQRSPSPIEKDSSDAEESVEQPPTKRHKDVQKAKSASLLIPVDETCPLAGKTSGRKSLRSHDD